jgi:hypothetical protein
VLPATQVPAPPTQPPTVLPDSGQGTPGAPMDTIVGTALAMAGLAGLALGAVGLRRSRSRR